MVTITPTFLTKPSIEIIPTFTEKPAIGSLMTCSSVPAFCKITYGCTCRQEEYRTAREYQDQAQH